MGLLWPGSRFSIRRRAFRNCISLASPFLRVAGRSKEQAIISLRSLWANLFKPKEEDRRRLTTEERPSVEPARRKSFKGASAFSLRELAPKKEMKQTKAET